MIRRQSIIRPLQDPTGARYTVLGRPEEIYRSICADLRGFCGPAQKNSLSLGRLPSRLEERVRAPLRSQRWEENGSVALIHVGTRPDLDAYRQIFDLYFNLSTTPEGRAPIGEQIRDAFIAYVRGRHG